MRTRRSIAISLAVLLALHLTAAAVGLVFPWEGRGFCTISGWHCQVRYLSFRGAQTLEFRVDNPRQVHAWQGRVKSNGVYLGSMNYGVINTKQQMAAHLIGWVSGSVHGLPSAPTAKVWYIDLTAGLVIQILFVLLVIQTIRNWSGTSVPRRGFPVQERR